ASCLCSASTSSRRRASASGDRAPAAAADGGIVALPFAGGAARTGVAHTPSVKMATSHQPRAVSLTRGMPTDQSSAAPTRQAASHKNDLLVEDVVAHQAVPVS